MDVRLANSGDEGFIVEMAQHACVIEDWPLPDPQSDDVLGLLPADTDLVIVAASDDGRRLGAVWTFPSDPPLIETSGLVIRELALAVIPDSRGTGVLSALVDDMVARSARTLDVLLLNVHQRNPARRLYQRKGFRAVGQGRGPLGIAMRRDLP